VLAILVLAILVFAIFVFEIFGFAIFAFDTFETLAPEDFFFAGVRLRAFFGTLERLSIGMTVPSGNLAEMTSSPPSASM
jgi:hypothetical protein